VAKIRWHRVGCAAKNNCNEKKSAGVDGNDKNPLKNTAFKAFSLQFSFVVVKSW
jgi:hypothetical protein